MKKEEAAKHHWRDVHVQPLLMIICYSPLSFPFFGIYGDIRVFADQRRHLAETELAACKRRSVRFAVVLPRKNRKVVNGKRNAWSVFYDQHSVGPGRIHDARNRVCALRDQVKTVAFPQIARVKFPLLRPFPPEIGDMEGVDFAVMILVVFARTRLDRRIEQIPAVQTTTGFFRSIYFFRWYGTVVTITSLRYSKYVRIIKLVWLCSRFCQLRFGMNWGMTTVT